MLSRLDQARSALGFSPLLPHPALDRAAEERAQELSGRPGLSSTGAEITRLTARLWRLGYGPHYWREALVAGELDAATLRRAELGADLLRQHLEHAAVVCRPRGSGSLCLVLVAERRLTHDLRAAEPLRDLAAVRTALLQEVNRVRAERSLDELSPHPAADRAAQLHAEAMLRLGFYGHQAPDGSGARQRVQAVGYRPRKLAENIAKVLTTPEDVVARWMSSSGHRRNLLLRRASQHGLGVAVGVDDGDVVALWCQLIAVP